MPLLQLWRVALKDLYVNKMRTALTMLGMVVGVSVVILVVAIGEGAKQRVTETVNTLGTNLLNVTSDRNKLRVGTAGFRSPTTAIVSATANATPINALTLHDTLEIARIYAESVDKIAPQIDSELQVQLGDADTTTEVAGTTVDYPYVKRAEVATGRFFTQDEIDGNQRVAVLGTTVAEHLTNNPNADLTNATIAINHQSFRVIGMLASKGTGAGGQDQDDILLIPVTTAIRRVLNRQALNNILIRCKTEDLMPIAQEQVTMYLRNRHHLQPPFPDNDDFRIRNQAEILRAQQAVTGTMTAMLTAVAAISLFIGGVGIMNIMLVSVTERTREIGIRKAIGATASDIRRQFLIEASLLSLLGGMIGIAVGIGCAKVMSDASGWTTVVNFNAVLTAVAVSGAVGIFFGLYPASKAAAMHPIDALRYE